jgi:hypothetical protein
MWLAALRHTEMVEELAALRAAVSSATQSVLGRSPNNTFHMEVVGELVTEFQKMEERCSRLERHAMRICDLLLGPPPGRARLADHLDKAARQLRVELAARWEVDVELEALRTLVTRVRDLVLDNADGPSSLAASMSIAVELLEGRIDAAAADGVRWWSCFALFGAVSHFSELKSGLELLWSGCNMELTEDEADALWTWCVQPRTRWHRMFLPQLLTAVLVMWGSSSGGRLCS